MQQVPRLSTSLAPDILSIQLIIITKKSGLRGNVATAPPNSFLLSIGAKAGAALLSCADAVIGDDRLPHRGGSGPVRC